VRWILPLGTPINGPRAENARRRRPARAIPRQRKADPMAARATGKSGKQPTINDVAALAGVSKKTVSRVINRSEFITEKTRLAVQQAIETLGFVPNPQARALAFRRNFLIALLHDNPNPQMVLNSQQGVRSEEHTSELQSLMRISYAVSCLKRKTYTIFGKLKR